MAIPPCRQVASFRAIYLLTLALLELVSAQETVFASVAFVRTGERIPLVDSLDNVTTLTPFGAQQMSTLGSLFRSRYMPRNRSGIFGLSVNEIDQEQTYFLSDDSQYSIASAQAFLQALYPPFSPSSGSSSGLSNGTTSQYPLSGYQYPWIQSVSPNDPRSIYIDGSSPCSAFVNNQSYANSTDFKDAQTASEELYAQVAGTLGNSDLPSDAIVFDNAFGVYDYFSWAYNHNSTIYSFLHNGTLQGALQKLRGFSNDYQWGFYGQPQVTTGQVEPTLNTIAGQTFTLAVLSRLAEAIKTSSTQGKLSILFGEFPAMLSFAALAQLPSANQGFYGMPEFASTMIFELFSNNSNNVGDGQDTSRLRVRFLFANGTDQIDNGMPSSFTTYPIFGTGQNDLSWDQFVDVMAQVAMPDPGTWCDVCDSWDTTDFCMAYNGTAWDAANGVNSGPRSTRFTGQMSAPLAGVIGAVCTLAALCIFLVLAVGCCGMRVVQRKNPGNNQAAAAAAPSGKRGLGGFKGPRKLASDPDLTSLGPKSPKKNRQSGISIGNGDEHVMGHERIGSWELKQPKRAASTKSRDEEEGWGMDGLGKEVMPNERV